MVTATENILSGVALLPLVGVPVQALVVIGLSIFKTGRWTPVLVAGLALALWIPATVLICAVGLGCMDGCGNQFLIDIGAYLAFGIAALGLVQVAYAKSR